MITHIIYKITDKQWRRAYLPQEADDKKWMPVPTFFPAVAFQGSTLDLRTKKLKPMTFRHPDYISIDLTTFEVKRREVMRGAYVIDDETADVLHKLDEKIEVLSQKIRALRDEQQAEMERASYRSRKVKVTDCKSRKESK